MNKNNKGSTNYKDDYSCKNSAVLIICDLVHDIVKHFLWKTTVYDQAQYLEPIK